MAYGRNSNGPGSRRRTVRQMRRKVLNRRGNKQWLNNYCMASGFRGLDKPENISLKISDIDGGNDAIMGGSICPDGQMPMDGECMSVVQWII